MKVKPSLVGFSTLLHFESGAEEVDRLFEQPRGGEVTVEGTLAWQPDLAPRTDEPYKNGLPWIVAPRIVK